MCMTSAHAVFELRHEQVYLGRQHVYLLELMHTSTALAGLKSFFIPTLVGGHLLHKSCCSWYGEWQECTSSSSIYSLTGIVGQPVVESLHE